MLHIGEDIAILKWILVRIKKKLMLLKGIDHSKVSITKYKAFHFFLFCQWFVKCQSVLAGFLVSLKNLLLNSDFSLLQLMLELQIEWRDVCTYVEHFGALIMQTYIRYTENLTLTSFERKWQNKISVKKKILRNFLVMH